MKSWMRSPEHNEGQIMQGVRRVIFIARMDDHRVLMSTNTGLPAKTGIVPN